ncbi:hypothetical protein Hanom_Chr02g00101541 [Helianthus anomalus]
MNDSNTFLMIITPTSTTIKPFKSSNRHITDESDLITDGYVFRSVDLRMRQHTIT